MKESPNHFYTEIHTETTCIHDTWSRGHTANTVKKNDGCNDGESQIRYVCVYKLIKGMMWSLIMNTG